MLDTVLIWIDKNRQRWLGDCKAWLKIPSVSTQPEHAGDVVKAAEWAQYYLRGIGLEVQVIPTARHPCILATTPESLAEPNAPHVLLYGHYDVQPPEPLDLWTSPPFEPTVRDGNLYARGACDDKGQVHCHLAALLAWKEINQKLPVRVTVLLEGEEEIGSPNLMAVVRQHAELLKTGKTMIISDSNMFAEGVPAITYGLRGMVFYEIVLRGANSDLHSGMYGGAVANPANILCQILGQLHDADRRITVPGFYDDVLALTETERQQWRNLPFSDAAFAAELGLQQLMGEAGFSTLERKWARPTLEINGLTSGYQGAGAKTVLPCLASAKVSMRLVPNQNPKDIAAKFERHIRSLVPPGLTVEMQELGKGSPGAITPLESPAMTAASEAIEIGYGKKPVFMREGGSIPVVTWLKEALGVDTVMLGFGLPNDNIHAPNEKLSLECYHTGIRTAAALYDRLGEHLK